VVARPRRAPEGGVIFCLGEPATADLQAQGSRHVYERRSRND
jgi:hypothetical protein